MVNRLPTAAEHFSKEENKNLLFVDIALSDCVENDKKLQKLLYDWGRGQTSNESFCTIYVGEEGGGEELSELDKHLIENGYANKGDQILLFYWW